jgi:hypothetical protein
MLSGNSVVFQIQGGTGRFAPCRFWMFCGVAGGEVLDGLRRAVFVCFMALPEGARCFDSLARSFPGCRPGRPSRLFFGGGDVGFTGCGKGL